MTYADLDRIYKSLTGTWRHYCGDWDELPIDETCPEFSCCTCTFDESFPQDGIDEAREAAQRIRERPDDDCCSNCGNFEEHCECDDYYIPEEDL